MKRTALICGIGGQDGALLAQFLLSKDYLVWGTSRDAQGRHFSNLVKLGILDRITLVSMAPEDFRSVLTAVTQSKPTEIYFLAGQSSVGLSFEQPAETMQSITLGTLNVLEACRYVKHPIRLYSAGSSECFGNTIETPASESTPFHPRSPYAVAKSAAFWLVSNYRDAYSIFACTGILFNHESSLRPARFVTQKVVGAAKRIANGSREMLSLGRLDIARDWGWADEYVEAMWLMLQQDRPDDFVIATGKTYSLENFVAAAFDLYNLDWRAHVVQDPTLFRPADLDISRADPQKAYTLLGWKASITMQGVVERMSHKIFV